MVWQIPVGRSYFTVRLWPTILTVCMLALLLCLGTWQVQRLHWKQNLIAEIDERTHQPAIGVDAITDATADEYRPILATGAFQNNKEFYLNAISLNGEGGYRLFVPLRLEDGSILFVDRGWIPYNKKAPEARPGSHLTGIVTVNGLLRLPHHIWMQPANNVTGNDWYSVDLVAMAQAADVDAPRAYYLEVDATPNPGGYPVGGQTHISLPNNHLSYAITWYGLALVLLVIYGVSGFRKVS